MMAPKKHTQLFVLKIVAIVIAIPILCVGIFWYNIHRSFSGFTLHRAEVTEEIRAIYEYRKEHNHWPKTVSEEVGITLPPGWDYYHDENNDRAMLFKGGRYLLRFTFEEGGNGVWSFLLEGSEIKWSTIARPLPSDPKQ